MIPRTYFFFCLHMKYIYIYICVCVYILAHMVMIWICSWLQRVIAAENSTACKDHESTRRAGANNVILLSENVNRMMGL